MRYRPRSGVTDCVTGPGQEMVVEECLAQEKEKEAVQLVKKFQLEGRFPQLAARHNELLVTSLIKRRKWGLAAQFAAQHPLLQVASPGALFLSSSLGGVLSSFLGLFLA